MAKKDLKKYVNSKNVLRIQKKKNRKYTIKQ